MDQLNEQQHQTFTDFKQLLEECLQQMRSVDEIAAYARSTTENLAACVRNIQEAIVNQNTLDTKIAKQLAQNLGQLFDQIAKMQNRLLDLEDDTQQHTQDANAAQGVTFNPWSQS